MANIWEAIFWLKSGINNGNEISVVRELETFNIFTNAQGIHNIPEFTILTPT